jgi:hypothetical protein
MHMNNKQALHKFSTLVFAAAVLIGAGCRPEAPPPTTRPKPSVTFKPKEMADALHAVIAADRDTYARYVLQEVTRDGTKTGLPPHLNRIASEKVQQKGAEFHYVVRSLWPIDPKNAPETATEKAGLEQVLRHPDAPYYSEESLGGRLYFTAIYPDTAILPLCAECHNQHPDSPKKDFKAGAVIGGIVVRVPLEF